MPVKLKIDSENCIGCGLCINTNPEAFDYDDDNKAKVIDVIDDGAVEDVIANCPVAAISK
ncbi:MAG TPA: ferredoxin [Candidatus Onthovivens sp.]|nr:ferredoxin [Candidatus Onthovivens sp.]